MKNSDIAIKLIGVSKKYEIHHEKPTLMEKFVKGKNETFWALKDINLTIKKGEKVGIIGPNGSGKTTLLKIISGITTPTTGILETYGKVVSLIDLEAGFHSDLTGVQNILLSGMILGMSKEKIKQVERSIIEFADIGKFIDAPLFTYSSGMILRLGFSIIVHSDPNILILDEGIFVGDINFFKKTTAKIDSFFKEGKTIILVSHWLDYMKKMCNSVYFIKNGKIFKHGDAKKTIALYEHNNG